MNASLGDVFSYIIDTSFTELGHSDQTCFLKLWSFTSCTCFMQVALIHIQLTFILFVSSSFSEHASE
ncbi:hypothetical protein HanIR_Chr06g0275861 [Helianthus annuus]|nr:hypothetical protein HanIR_Chr06g0275861 [Helianthus annuus]